MSYNIKEMIVNPYICVLVNLSWDFSEIEVRIFHDIIFKKFSLSPSLFLFLLCRVLI